MKNTVSTISIQPLQFLQYSPCFPYHTNISKTFLQRFVDTSKTKRHSWYQIRRDSVWICSEILLSPNITNIASIWKILSSFVLLTSVNVQADYHLTNRNDWFLHLFRNFFVSEHLSDIDVGLDQSCRHSLFEVISKKNRRTSPIGFARTRITSLQKASVQIQVNVAKSN